MKLYMYVCGLVGGWVGRWWEDFLLVVSFLTSTRKSRESVAGFHELLSALCMITQQLDN